MFKTPANVQVTENHLHLVTGGNENYFLGIQVTIASALAGLPLNHTVFFHILDGGLSPRAKRLLGLL